MKELKYMLVFALALIACVVSGLSALWALGLGVGVFFVYGLRNGFSAKALVKMALSGIKSMMGIFITFFFIGALTAVWRQCGTIPYIVYYATSICSEKIMLLLTFLLCGGMSMLTGTAFGTAATMGVICVTMSVSMGISPLWAGGAMLSGIYIGDRGSPVSTCALFVAGITGTEHYTNVRRMLRSAAVPVLVCVIVYAIAGLGASGGEADQSVRTMFAESFVMHPVELVPAAIIVVFALFRLNVRLTMGVSILAGAVIATAVQRVSVLEVLKGFVLGFHTENAALEAVMGGGGIVSMVTVFIILIISGTLSGIFRGTGFMVAMSSITERIANALTPFGCVIAASTVMVMISCNQSLAVVLTQQLCAPVVPSKQQLADDINCSTVTIAGLIPWSIAAAMPLSLAGASTGAIPFACFLYLVPLWHLIVRIRNEKKETVK